MNFQTDECVAFADHHYKAVSPGIENERLMTFYHEARVDGLERRVENPTEMTEQFINRPDFLYFRQVFFGKRAKKFAPSSESNPRPILVGRLFKDFKSTCCFVVTAH